MGDNNSNTDEEDQIGHPLRQLTGRRPLQAEGPFFVQIVVEDVVLRIVYKILPNNSIEWNFSVFRPYVGWVRSNVYRSQLPPYY